MPYHLVANVAFGSPGGDPDPTFAYFCDRVQEDMDQLDDYWGDRISTASVTGKIIERMIHVEMAIHADSGRDADLVFGLAVNAAFREARWRTRESFGIDYRHGEYEIRQANRDS